MTEESGNQTRRGFLAGLLGAAAVTAGSIWLGYNLASRGQEPQAQPIQTPSAQISSQKFYEDFANLHFEGQKWRNADFLPVLQAPMYVGNGTLHGRNAWDFYTIGDQVPPGNGIVALYPEIGGKDPFVVFDVPAGTAMGLYTDNKISFKKPATLSFTTIGYHDSVKMQAYFKDRQIGGDITPQPGKQERHEIEILDGDIDDRLRFVVRDPGNSMLGCSAALGYIQIVGY